MEIKKKSLQTILENIAYGKYKIPEFQRDFIWKGEAILSLMESVFKNYPIGSFLTLSTENLRLSETDLDFDSGGVELKKKFTKCEFDGFYILDGQQRITSIARAFSNSDNKYSYFLDLENFILLSIKNHHEDLKSYLNEDLLSEIESRDLFFKYKKEKDGHVLIKNIHQLRIDLLINNEFLEMSTGFDFDNYVEDFIFKFKIPDDKTNIKKIKNLINKRINDIFNIERFVFQELDKQETIESVCRIFEIINNTGTKLEIFDLLVAKLYNNNIKLTDIYKEIEPHLNLLDLSRENFLHIFLIQKQIKNFGNPALSKENLFKLEIKDFLDNKEYMIAALNNFYKWINDFKIYKGMLIDTLVSLLVSIEANRLQQQQESLFKKDKISILIKNLLITRIFTSQYNKTQVPLDYKSLKNVLNHENSCHEEFETAKKQLFKNYQIKPITSEDIFKEAKQKRKLFKVLMTILYTNSYKNIDGSDYINFLNYEEHHIIPKKICSDFKIDKKFSDSAANFILINNKLNKEISSKSPSLYFNDLLTNHLNKTHFSNLLLLPISESIEDNFINYETYLIKRAVLLAEYFNKYIIEHNLI